MPLLRHHRPTSWLAIALLLFISLSPMLKPSADSDAGWVEMCSGHGPAMSAAPAPGHDPLSSASEPDDGWCKLHCSLLQLPSASLATSVFRSGVRLPAALSLSLPLTERVWPGALGRAPPRTA